MTPDPHEVRGGVATAATANDGVTEGTEVVSQVTGDVAKRGDWSSHLLSGDGEEVGLEGGEDGDQEVDVIDPQTHLR